MHTAFWRSPLGGWTGAGGRERVGDPLYVDILKYHWIEENQRTKTGVLEIAQLARALSPDELSSNLPRRQSGYGFRRDEGAHHLTRSSTITEGAWLDDH